MAPDVGVSHAAEASKDDNDDNGKPPADDGTGGLGGMGLGMSMADLEANRQTTKAVEDLTVLVSDLDKELKALKSSAGLTSADKFDERRDQHDTV